MLLIDAKADRLAILARLPLFEENVSIYTHPALVGDRRFVRGPQYLFGIDLKAPQACTATSRIDCVQETFRVAWEKIDYNAKGKPVSSNDA